jgi:hypothetical protein
MSLASADCVGNNSPRSCTHLLILGIQEGNATMAGLAMFDQKNSIEETTPINTAF